MIEYLEIDCDELPTEYLVDLVEIDCDESPIDLSFWGESYGYRHYETYFKTVNQKLKSDAKFAFKYARKNGRLTDERVFLNDPEPAFLYSFLVINCKLPSSIEKVFIKSAKWALAYATYVYKGRLPKNLEKAFENDPESAYNYSIFINQRLEEKTENVFLRDTIEERGDVLHEDFFWACLYAKNVLKGKFPEKTHKSLFLRYSFDDGCNKKFLKEYFDENKA